MVAHDQTRIYPMSSISSIPPSVPVKAPEASEPKGPEVKIDGDSDDSRTSPPPVQAALPPGQGTRIDQIA
jgi:hypothetical protein